MTPTFILTGRGTLPKHIIRSLEAIDSDVEVLTYHEGACECGHGCKPHSCELAARWAVQVPNRGMTAYEQQIRREATDVLAAAGL